MLFRSLALILENLQEQAQKEEQIRPRLRLPNDLAKSMRQQLSNGAAQWACSQKSLVTLNDIAQTMATLLAVPEPIHLCISRSVAGNASTVIWAERQLLLDPGIADTLQQDDSGKLFARVQRDLLENLLLRRYFNDVGDIRKASPGQRRQVWRAIEQVESQAPAIQLSGSLRAHIGQVMATRGQLGTVQISPTVGAALGHSWIAPCLSLMPDHHQQIGRAHV